MGKCAVPRASQRRAVVATVPRSARGATATTRASVNTKDVVYKLLGPAVALHAATITHPAFALVNDKLAASGRGLERNADNKAIGVCCLIVFGTIWAFYYDYVSKDPFIQNAGND